MYMSRNGVKRYVVTDHFIVQVKQSVGCVRVSVGMITVERNDL